MSDILSPLKSKKTDLQSPHIIPSSAPQFQWQVDIGIHDESDLKVNVVGARALIILNVEVTESTEALRGVE